MSLLTRFLTRFHSPASFPPVEESGHVESTSPKPDSEPKFEDGGVEGVVHASGGKGEDPEDGGGREPKSQATATDLNTASSQPMVWTGKITSTKPDSDHPNFEDGGGKGEDMDRRKVLPEELMRNVVVLSCESTAEGGVCDVYVVGTIHYSQESCKQVEAVISYLKPQVVFLELCQSRAHLLVPSQNILGNTKHEDSGCSEFRVAYEEAMKYGGKVILGDRDIIITHRRTINKMSLWQSLFQVLKFRTLVNLYRMHQLKKKENDDSYLLLAEQEIDRVFPTFKETLVHERDQYMSSSLLSVASKHSSVVAVVGSAHLQGIKKHWQQPVEMKDLMQMPAQKPVVSSVTVIASLGVAAAGVAIISRRMNARKRLSSFIFQARNK